MIGPCTDPRCIKAGAKLGFVSSLASFPCLLLTTKLPFKNSMLVNRQSRRLKIVDEQRRIDYSRRRFGRWQKKRRDGNRRRKRTGDGRRMRGRGGLRLRRRSMLDRRSWKR
jgi:predicted chitinase